jgi:HPt (histidine-containing phosphotransfer) domain-containing protein
VDGDEDLLRDIVALFLSSYPAFISEIRDAIARNDSNALARAAHTLKGSGGFLLDDSATKLVSELELIGHGGDLNSAPARLVGLEAEMERLKPELFMLAAEGTQSQEE